VFSEPGAGEEAADGDDEDSHVLDDVISSENQLFRRWTVSLELSACY